MANLSCGYHACGQEQRVGRRLDCYISANIDFALVDASLVVPAARLPGAAERAAASIRSGSARLVADETAATSLTGRLPSVEAIGSQAEATAIMRASTPRGLSLSQFGDEMGWGSGHAAARARMASITAQEARAIGLTSDMAKGWARAYDATAKFNPANPSAAGRAELMWHTHRLLE